MTNIDSEIEGAGIMDYFDLLNLYGKISLESGTFLYNILHLIR